MTHLTMECAHPRHESPGVNETCSSQKTELHTHPSQPPFLFPPPTLSNVGLPLGAHPEFFLPPSTNGRRGPVQIPGVCLGSATKIPSLRSGMPMLAFLRRAHNTLQANVYTMSYQFVMPMCDINVRICQHQLLCVSFRVLHIVVRS